MSERAKSDRLEARTKCISVLVVHAGKKADLIGKLIAKILQVVRRQTSVLQQDLASGSRKGDFYQPVLSECIVGSIVALMASGHDEQWRMDFPDLYPSCSSGKPATVTHQYRLQFWVILRLPLPTIFSLSALVLLEAAVETRCAPVQRVGCRPESTRSIPVKTNSVSRQHEVKIIFKRRLSMVL